MVPEMTAHWRGLDAVLRACPGRCGVLVCELGEAPRVRYALNSGELLAAASVGKLALLVTAADLIGRRLLDPREPLLRDPGQAVADSGIWQHLTVDELPLTDVARLIGLASDNWATNVLLDRVGGPAAVAQACRRLRIDGIELLDRVRDHRGPTDIPTLSRASADGCVALWRRLHDRDFADPAIADTTLGWLDGGFDTSMVLDPLHLDPLARAAEDRGYVAINKTGTDAGIRADTGIVRRSGRVIAYACIVNWPADESREAVVAALRAVGRHIRAELDLS